jgi:hypothetical protein
MRGREKVDANGECATPPIARSVLQRKERVSIVQRKGRLSILQGKRTDSALQRKGKQRSASWAFAVFLNSKLRCVKPIFKWLQEKGLAASTILETDDSLPHLSEDWSHPYSNWPLLLDGSSFKVIPLSSISPHNSSVFSAFDIGETNLGQQFWICHATLTEGEVMGEKKVSIL